MREFKTATEIILTSVAIGLTLYFIISCMGGI